MKGPAFDLVLAFCRAQTERRRSPTRSLTRGMLMGGEGIVFLTITRPGEGQDLYLILAGLLHGV